MLRSEIESRWLRGNSDKDLSRFIAGDCCSHRSNSHLVRFADIDAALEERSIPNSDSLCSYIPVNEPSLRMSTRSVA
jgi:hypothetical protein